jgi:hypothetical protein
LVIGRHQPGEGGECPISCRCSSAKARAYRAIHSTKTDQPLLSLSSRQILRQALCRRPASFRPHEACG